MTRSRAWAILLFLLILIPSAQFAWRNRDMPQFAYLHDDGILFTSAKSLANGNGYRIASMPENPPQTKQPPLYPLLLSLVWLWNPVFPQNLTLATLLCWLTLISCLAAAAAYYKTSGIAPGERWGLLALLGLSPFMILFGCTMFSEVLFTTFVLLALFFAQKEGGRAFVLALIAANCAYLTRTAGIALLVALPVLWISQKQFRRAVYFLASTIPCAVLWTVWSAMERPATADATLLYYVDYVRFWKMNVGLDNLPVLLWKNADQLLYGMGALVVPKVADMLPLKILTEVIGVAMISGTIRLTRRGVMVDYAWFAFFSCLMLLVWHYPPNERFVLPLFPLLIAGLSAEVHHFAGMLRPAFRHKDWSQRIVAGGMAMGITVILLAALSLQMFMSFFLMHENARQQRLALKDRINAYQWIARNIPPSASILSYDDALLYLYSGRRGNYLPLMPRWWYAEDHAQITASYRDIAEYCRSRGLSYVYFTDQDLSRETGDEDRRTVAALLRDNRQLVPLYHSGIGTVFRIQPTSP